MNCSKSGHIFKHIVRFSSGLFETERSDDITSDLFVSKWGSQWMGGPDVVWQILKTVMSHVIVARKIGLSLIRNTSVRGHSHF